MKLVPSRPVTIVAERNAERWFPFLYRHTDGSLLLYIENGHDMHFSPLYRSRSVDGGRTWLEEGSATPRTTWAHSFADGTLLELDAYGFLDPRKSSTYCYYAAWSVPGDANRKTERGLVRMHSPSLGATSIVEMQKQGGYPTFPWWPLFNDLHKNSEVRGEDVLVGGPYITAGIKVGSRLLAAGYNASRDSAKTYVVVCMESLDRGRTWKECGIMARGAMNEAATPEGFTEASLVQLKDGRLHSALRSGDQLFQVWSSDEGRTWTEPKPLSLIDSDHRPRMVWPSCQVLADGSLVLAYGRPGKHLIFDPTGTGEQWQGRLDLHAWELETQEMMGVRSELRLHGDTEQCIRYWDSSDYLGLAVTGPRELLATYDVQSYYESWNAVPVSGVRLVRVRLED